MSDDLTSIVVCKSIDDAETYRKLLVDAGFACSIVESNAYSDSTSYEVSVPESDYDRAFAVVEEYEEG